MAVIALMTDFGTRDHYVASMKGVILQINPNVTIVDVTHDIAAQDLVHGAFVLRQSLPFFPPGTIFVAVVDPTVGSSRPILAARYSDRVVLAPDNGLLTLLHRDAQLQEIRVVENRRFFANTISSTFHGRDVFAPVAAHLSTGVALGHLGPSADHIEILDLTKPAFDPDGSIVGEVMLVDLFGILITNVSTMDLPAPPSAHGSLRVSVADKPVGPIHTTYADAAVGEPIAIIGSSQMLEIAVNRGNAAEKLQAKRGTAVRVTSGRQVDLSSEARARSGIG